jgi:hypothetical protein
MRQQQPEKIKELLEVRISTVEGGSKRRRGGSVAAVQFGGAHECSPVRKEDWGVSPNLLHLRREAPECEPTWSSGETFAGRC